MKTRMLIMRPEAPHETREVELKDKFGFVELRGLIEPITGHPMEHVRVFSDFSGGTEYKYLDMFVNELGRLTGLERNEAATIIYRRNTLYHEPGKYEPEELDWIAGPAVLFEHQVWS